MPWPPACAVCLVVNDTQGVDLPERAHILNTNDTSSLLTVHDADSPDWARVLIASPPQGSREPNEARTLATEIADRAGRVRISGLTSPPPGQLLSTRQAAELREIAAITETAGLPLLAPAILREFTQAPILHLRESPDTAQATASPRGVPIYASTLLGDLERGGTHAVKIG